MQENINPTLPTETVSTSRSKSTKWRVWKDIFWLFLIAILFRWIVLEPYTIPTASMEGTLWRGDFILVSKWHYGARTPNTWLQMPLTFRKIWFTAWDSYVDFPEARLPITRLPALAPVKRGDLVVFNYPKELSYPIELRTPYIKRCVAVAGDTLQIVAGKVQVNGQETPKIPTRKYRYFIQSTAKIADNFFKKNHLEDYKTVKIDVGFGYMIDATRQEIEALGKLPEVKQIIMQSQPVAQRQSDIFPQNGLKDWNEDNFGALIVPRKGMTVQMSAHHLALYGQLIKDHEIYGTHKRVEIKNNQLYLDGRKVKQYTFQQDYFFMLGDNFHNSADSRFWGFVPQDHLIGKAFYVCFSLAPDKTIRWDRIGSVE